jgi:hypothetical protein
MADSWDLPELNRVGWLVRRIVGNFCSRLQPADCEDLVSEAVSIALALNVYRPDIYSLSYRHILKCIKTAGLRLGFFVPRNHHPPTLIRFSDLDTSLSYEMKELADDSYRENVVDLNSWKKCKAHNGRVHAAAMR